MATLVWVNINSDNGLVPDGTKPLPELMLTDHQLGYVAFNLMIIFTGNTEDMIN